MWASGDSFKTLGVPALTRRTFNSADDVRTGSPVGSIAIIGYPLWQRRFGGAANVIAAPLIAEGVSSRSSALRRLNSSAV